jgi:hypothetical protein
MHVATEGEYVTGYGNAWLVCARMIEEANINPVELGGKNCIS